MKPVYLASCVLAASLAIATPSPVFAHVGHGDEFQAEGGINRVRVNAETDALLGIQVTPIEPSADGNSAVLIPVTALVDANGKQLVFVQYENFYEPVPVTVGATRGELVEVTKGLAVGEKLVTQGSLSLYAESRKTQTATTPTVSASPETAPSQAQQSGFPVGILAAVGGGVVLLGGGIAVLSGNRKKRGTVSARKEEY